ncbi:MAG: hypothetical protein QXU40_01255, partial [Candidatus Pacearchaeota archaeon]
FFSVVKKKVIKKGPEVSDEKNAQRFKEKHKHVFVKEGRLFCEEEMNLRLKKFLETWAEKYKAHMKEMYINKLKILEPSD